MMYCNLLSCLHLSSYHKPNSMELVVMEVVHLVAAPHCLLGGSSAGHLELVSVVSI